MRDCTDSITCDILFSKSVSTDEPSDCVSDDVDAFAVKSIVSFFVVFVASRYERWPRMRRAGGSGMSLLLSSSNSLAKSLRWDAYVSMWVVLIDDGIVRLPTRIGVLFSKR